MAEKRRRDQGEMAHRKTFQFALRAAAPNSGSLPFSATGSAADPVASRQKPAPPPLAAFGYVLVGVLLFGFVAAVLWAMGRPLVCDCRDVLAWQGGRLGGENSQHLSDWYSALHIVFGMLFFALMWRTSRHWPTGWLFVAAVVAGAGWEIVENTPFIIARYGQGPAGAGYLGDSIPNALSDMCFVLIGFGLASRLPARWTLGLGLAAEIATSLAIRDSLAIGTIMLLHPVDAIAAWQAGAFPS